MKAPIVAETLEPEATVGEVARRHGLPTSHVSSRRTPGGAAGPAAPEDLVEFPALMVAPSDEAPSLARRSGWERGSCDRSPARRRSGVGGADCPGACDP
ncbi:transposase [Cereibacter sphaeroides]|uniref:hypothetical protein n=1 Tax=Cereibacter sphaeroides TaxID=1063 RepID=UPI003AF1DE61|nr:transposase [Cereibacter sphaeroides]MCE6973405.1 transposase [Cereibacter sphaeroides]